MQSGQGFPDANYTRPIFANEPKHAPWRGLPASAVLQYDAFYREGAIHVVGKRFSHASVPVYTYGSLFAYYEWTLKDDVGVDVVVRTTFKLQSNRVDTFYGTTISRGVVVTPGQQANVRDTVGLWYTSLTPIPPLPWVWVALTGGAFGATLLPQVPIDYNGAPFFGP